MPDTHDDFYVGYLPAPPRHVRFLRVLIPPTLTVLACIMAAIAFTQRSPGPAIWHDATPISITGALYATPYPVLFTDDNTAYFLVEQGKRGAQQRAAPHHAHRATITGWLLERDDRKILELVPEDDAIRAHEPVPELPITSIPTFAPITAHGEIVDAKCYLGAMKPGDGKAHKACATLCITSGIPALFISGSSDTPAYHLILDTSHQPATNITHDFIGEPITLTPTLAKWGPLDIYLINTNNITRP